MTQTYLDDPTYRWQRSALRRRAERRPLEVQAEIASECSRSSLRLLLSALRSTDQTHRWGSPAPHGRV
jgi:hypothetical protein